MVRLSFFLTAVERRISMSKYIPGNQKHLSLEDRIYIENELNKGETFKDTPYNCAQTIHIIPADPNFEKKRSSSALFAREINLVTQPSFDCEQGINSQVQTVCSNADAVFPVLGIVFCKNERFSLSRKTHVPLWNEPWISHVRLL